MWHNLTKFNFLALKENFTYSQYKKQTTIAMYWNFLNSRKKFQ